MQKAILTILFLAMESFLPLLAQSVVDVKNEPRHHNIFENEYVRILDVHIPPRDTSLFHKHSLPSIFLSLSNVRSGSQVITENKNAPARQQGNISFEDFTLGSRIHRVWNSDSVAEFHPMDIELLHKNPVIVAPTLKDEALQLVFDVVQSRAYRFILAAHSDKSLLPVKVPLLIICLSDSESGIEVNGKTFRKKGDYLFIEPLQIHRYKNGDDKSTELAVIEIK